MAGLTVMVAVPVQAAVPQPVAEEPVAVNDFEPPLTMSKLIVPDETHAPGVLLELEPAVQLEGTDAEVKRPDPANETVSPAAKPNAAAQVLAQDWPGKPDVSFALVAPLALEAEQEVIEYAPPLVVTYL